MKKITKSNKNKIVAGIFGGIGEYFDTDPTLLRLIGLFLFIFSGFVPFVLVYIVAVFIVPKSEEQIKIDAEKPAYKKGWFWVLLLLCLFLILPVLAFILFTFSSTSCDVGIEVVEEEVVSDFERPDREEVVNYLKNIGPSSEFDGEIFADYYEFEVKRDEMLVWAYISEYFLDNGDLSEGVGVSGPYVIIFSDDGIDGYWQPKEDDYTGSIRSRFPQHLHDSVLNFHSERNEELDKLIRDVENKAEDELTENN